jgi:hypothetical protein
MRLIPVPSVTRLVHEAGLVRVAPVACNRGHPSRAVGLRNGFRTHNPRNEVRRPPPRNPSRASVFNLDLR